MTFLEVFGTIFSKLIPLYFVIVLGYIAGRFLHVKRESIASLLIYLIAPVVIFFGIMNAEISASRVSLPFIFFILCCSISILFFKISGKIWGSPTKNILGFAAGTGNTGYFGFPVAIAVFGEQALGLMILSAFGFILFENTLGFFLTARGHHTAKDSLIRVLKLPTVYAFFLALALNLSGFKLSKTVLELGHNFRGAYSILGMMMIGLGISNIPKLEIDFKFTGVAFAAKFLVWPALVGGLVFLDYRYLHFFDSQIQIYNVMLLTACVPMAANTVAIATALRTEPEKTGVAVILSTLVALFYIPFLVAFLL